MEKCSTFLVNNDEEIEVNTFFANKFYSKSYFKYKLINFYYPEI